MQVVARLGRRVAGGMDFDGAETRQFLIFDGSPHSPPKVRADYAMPPSCRFTSVLVNDPASRAAHER